jgi:cytochrome c553
MKQWVWLALWCCSTAWADMSFEDMLHERTVEERPVSEAERLTVQRERKAAQAAAELARQQIEAARAAAEAARPYPERLLDSCAACHAPAALAGVSHSWLGWYLTLSRMRWLNGASLDHAQILILTDHLTQRQPADQFKTLREYLVVALPVVLPLLLWLGWRRFFPA